MRWTCDCDPVFYALRQAGGLGFVLRTTRARNNPSIDESDRRPAEEAEEADAMWITRFQGLVR